jgi:AraC-like DNA-binding protein
MAAILGGSAGSGLERSCGGADWVRSHGPVQGVELLQAWFGGGAFSSHRHATYAIGVTEVGIQTFDYRGKVESSHPGQVLVLHPDEVHDGRAGSEGGFGYRIVYVDPACIAEAIRAIRGRPTALPFIREPVADNPKLAGAVNAAFRSSLEPLAVDALVLRLAEGLLDPNPGPHSAHPPRPLDRTALARLDRSALARCRAVLDRRRTTVGSVELEALTGLSRYELARQFRALYGTSPHRYALMRRLDFARVQLGRGLALADLAQTAGFADQAHFTRAFKSAYGVTPGTYARLQATPAA